MIQTNVTQVQSYASPLQTAMDSDPAKAIRQTITALVDGIPALLKVLDDVAQIHPFIKSMSWWARGTTTSLLIIRFLSSRRRRFPCRD